MGEEIKHIIFSVSTLVLAKTVRDLRIEHENIISISYEGDIAHIKIEK